MTAIPQHGNEQETEDIFAGTLDLRGIIKTLGRGISQILALGLLGLSLSTVTYLLLEFKLTDVTRTRVTFSFDGFDKGEYPDHSRFQPDDLRTPEIILEAIKRQGLPASDTLQTEIRNALEIEAIFPESVLKQRDRLRNSGQTPPLYVPDEYEMTLSLPHNSSISNRQREVLLRDIAEVFREHFTRTYEKLPTSFGSVFTTLSDSDFPDYEMEIAKDLNALTTFLEQRQAMANSYRSQSTNLSFNDLLENVNNLRQIEFNEVLGVIWQNGLSKDRRSSLIKIDYRLRSLRFQEQQVLANQGVINDLLMQVQSRSPSYILGVKGQLPQPQASTPIIDQGLLDSLLANDSYNMLVRKALDNGVELKQIQYQEAQLLDKRTALNAFLEKDPGDQSAIIKQVRSSLTSLESHYNNLVSSIRRTNDDFIRQQYANAVQISDAVTTRRSILHLIESALIGLILGITAGAGFCLLGIDLRHSKSASRQS